MKLRSVSMHRVQIVALAGLAALLMAPPAWAQSEHQVVLDAREALRKKDRTALVTASVAVQRHPLAQWVEYWELSNRLGGVQADEIETFYARGIL